jgi:hypothetical protein
MNVNTFVATTNNWLVSAGQLHQGLCFSGWQAMAGWMAGWLTGGQEDPFLYAFLWLVDEKKGRIA